MKHHPTCHASYPEKPKGERPQQYAMIEIGEGEAARICVDCGATDIVKSSRVALIDEFEVYDSV